MQFTFDDNRLSNISLLHCNKTYIRTAIDFNFIDALSMCSLCASNYKLLLQIKIGNLCIIS